MIKIIFCYAFFGFFHKVWFTEQCTLVTDVGVISYICMFFNNFFHGYEGFYEYLKLKGQDVESHVGLDVLIDGTFAAGLFHCPCLYIFHKHV